MNKFKTFLKVGTRTFSSLTAQVAKSLVQLTPQVVEVASQVVEVTSQIVEVTSQIVEVTSQVSELRVDGRRHLVESVGEALSGLGKHIIQTS